MHVRSFAGVFPFVTALLIGLLLLACSPLRAAPALPDSVRVKRLLRVSDSLISLAPPRALALADSARQLAHRRGLASLEIQAILATATTYQLKADYPQATAFAQQAYRLARRSGKPSSHEWNALNLLSAVAYYRERFPEAVGYMRQKLAVAEKLGIDQFVARSLDDLGSTLSELRQCREADGYLRRALAGYERMRDRKLAAIYKARVLANIAVNEFYQGRLPEAIAAATLTLQAARQQTDSSTVLNAYSVRATCRSHAGQHAGAVADAEYALRLAQHVGHVDELSAIRAELPGIYERAGRLREALAAERALRQLKDSIRSTSVEQKLAELNTRFGVEQQKAHIVQLTQQQRITALRADKARAQARLWGGLAAALAILLAAGGWLLRQVRRSRARLVASEAELRAANQVKDQINATKDQVMRIIGHDLRAPLATFEQFAPVLAELADAPDPGEQRQLATALADRARAVRELVDNLLSWSRAQTGDLAAFPQPVRLAQVAQSMQRVFAPVAAAKGVALQVTCAPDLPDELRTDPNLLSAVVRNLLGNAIKFTPAGGTVRLDIATSAPAGAAGSSAAAVVTITDTGRGMQPVRLAAALSGQPVDSTAGTNHEPGSGLGLAVCWHFVRLLRAEWRGESEPGQGTRWTLALPAAI